MRLLVLIAGSLVGLMLSTDVIAQPPTRQEGQQPQQRTAADFISRLRSLDVNKDGKIAKDELPERMQSILTRVDTNKDEVIDEQELKTLEDRFKGNATQRPQGRNEQPADRPQGQRPQGRASGQPAPQAQQGQQRTVGGFIARLREMDANQDGKISKDELPERMRSILTRVDTNNDDSIDEKELEALAKRFSGNTGQRPQGDGQQAGRPQGQRPPGFGGQGGRPGQGGQPEQPGGRPNGFGANNPQGQRPPGFGGQGGRPGQGGQPGQPGGANALPPLPIFMVLDRDRNGELSKEEMANAAKALSQLDRDRNGKLTIEELMPAGFGRGGRPGQGGAGAAGSQGGRPGQGGQPGQPGGFGGQGGRPGQPGQPGGGRGTQRPQRPE